MALASLSGCALSSGDRPTPKSLATLAADQSLAGAQGTFPDATWWDRYQDPALTALMAEALASSPDMALATARIAAADALATQAGGALWPALGIEGSAGGAKQSYNMGIPAEFVPKGIVSTGQIAGRMGFNLDIWGRNRAALAAARGEAEAARVDAAQARLLLTTSVASAWADYAQVLRARDIAAEAVRVRSQTESLTQARLTAGIDGQSDLELAKSRAAAAQADLAAADEALTLTRNRIAALLGAGPDRGATLPRPALTEQGVPPLPDRLAAELLGRRPDIVSAQLRVEAARQRIKMAQRDFYPNINLTALVGVQALGLANLFDQGSSTANFGPALSLPLFDGGRRLGQYRGATAGYAEAVARYDQILITALRETADAIASRQAIETRRIHLRTASDAAQQSAQLAQMRYRAGIGNMLQVNAAEDAALAARRALSDTEARAMLYDIALIRALGGGFQAPNPQKDGNRP